MIEPILKKYILDFFGTNKEIEVIKLVGDVSTRQYYRLFLDSGETFILTLYPQAFDRNKTAMEAFNDGKRISKDYPLTYSNCPAAQIELTHFLKNESFNVPQIIDINGDLRAILFEDLGDLRLFDILDTKPISDIVNYYEKAIDSIIKYQNLTIKAKESGLFASKFSFSTEKYLWEYEFFIKWYFLEYSKLNLTNFEILLLKQEFLPLCEYLSSRSHYLCHRDNHCRNLMIYNDELYWIDYQDSRLGSHLYDLVSLIYDPYPFDKNIDISKYRNAFLEYYCAKKNIEYSEIKDELRFMSIQRLLKAIGTFSCQTIKNKDKSFEKHLKNSLIDVKSIIENDLDNILNLPKLCSLLGL